MTDAIEFGPEIKVEGERPEWLDRGVKMRWALANRDGTAQPFRAALSDTCINWSGMGYGVFIRLPIDHEYYRSKPSEQTVEDDGYVRVKRMSEAEWASMRMSPVLWARASGIIRPETPVERFKRENPGCDDWTNAELIEAAAKFFGADA